MNIERSMRKRYLIRAFTGYMTPRMHEIKYEWERKGGKKAFTRLSCLRWALTHWGYSFDHGYVMLLPYGGLKFIYQNGFFNLNVILFSICLFRRIKK